MLVGFLYWLVPGGKSQLDLIFFSVFLGRPQIMLSVTTIRLLGGHSYFKGLQKGGEREGSWEGAMTSYHPVSDQATPS